MHYTNFCEYLIKNPVYTHKPKNERKDENTLQNIPEKKDPYYRIILNTENNGIKIRVVDYDFSYMHKLWFDTIKLFEQFNITGKFVLVMIGEEITLLTKE